MNVGFGKTLDTSQKGKYIVVFRYIVESVGLKAANEAVSLFEAIAEGKSFDVNQIVSDLNQRGIGHHNQEF